MFGIFIAILSFIIWMEIKYKDTEDVHKEKKND